MRPKSIATVVVRLSGTAAVSSTPSDAAVMVSSVRSGGISETARTSVVLPTPKPPATRILRGMSSAGTEAIQESGEDLRRGAVRVPRGVDGRGGPASARSLTSTRATPIGTPRPAATSTRATGAAGEVEDGAVLGLEVVGGAVRGGRGDDRLDREVVVARPGAAAGDGVHGHDAPVLARIVGHRATPVRGPGVSACPARVTSIVIS